MNMNEHLQLREELDIQHLMDLPKSSRIILKGIEDHHDVITAHVIFMHQEMSSLLGPLMYQAAKNMKVKNDVILSTMVKVLKHVLAVCEACEYDIPTNDELMEYDISTTHYLVKQDSILTLTDMCMAALDIIHVVNVDLEGLTIWSEENVPQDMVDSIKTIIIGIKNLGKKHDFTLRDVISNI
jgi:enamine deaminase RidA (YjgF/YER057c/UK114 family)